MERTNIYMVKKDYKGAGDATGNNDLIPLVNRVSVLPIAWTVVCM